MNETVISVRGEFCAQYPAEQAAVQVDIAFDGEDRDVVFDAAVTTTNSVRESITALHDPVAGPVVSWSADGVSVWSERPWNSEGRRLPPVIHSRIGVYARFSDFAVLSTWIEEIVAFDGVTLADVVWSLTPARLTAATTEVRSRAVKDAVSKAAVYAQSIGLGSVRAVALADPGMLGEQGGGALEQRHIPMSAMRSVGAAELSLKPRQIEVSAAVDGRFVAF